MKEEKEFQAESKQLLDLMINSIYSNKEIFLREIVSNASDAIDKYRFLSLTDSANYPASTGEIRIEKDEKEKTISITDNGIGMSKEDMETNLGTIAKSGSKDFAKKYQEAKQAEDLSIIGQFGVGFYSSFMVADSVEVLSKPHNGQAHRFLSSGKDTYTIEDAEADFDHGTKVTIHLKKDSEGEKYASYLQDWKIEELIRKYSDYIRYPIKMMESHQELDKDEDGKEIEGKSHEVQEDKTLNSMTPLWKKNAKDVTEAELNEFYKSKFDDFEDPLISLNVHIEGLISYDALVYIPAHAPYDLYSSSYEKGLSLYSKGIFIQDKCKELVPDFLKFCRGLVDSEDFPLNISREMLQKSPLMSKIESSLEKKILEKLAAVQKNDKERYNKFFKLYGNYLKYGIYSTYGMKKNDLQDLLQFSSLNSEAPISFKEYVASMKEGQKDIFYASGKSAEEIKMLPQLEKFKKEGINVLILDQEIDEFAIMALMDYDKHGFKNIASEDKDSLSEEEKTKLETLTADHKRILDEMKTGLEGKVDEVAFSTKLVDSPVCITTKNGMSMNVERVLDEQPGASENEKPKATKVLEINAEHPLFKAITTINDDAEIQKCGKLLYDEAMLLEGFEIEDKKQFVENLNSLMMKAFH